MADKREETEPEPPREAAGATRSLLTPRLVEIVVIEGIAVSACGWGLDYLINFKYAHALLDFGIGVSVAVAGAASLLSADYRQRVLYSCGAFLGPLICQLLIYHFAIQPRINTKGFFYQILYQDDGLVGYIVALLVGFALAFEMEIRHRRHRPVMIPLNYPVGMIMGIGSVLTLWVLGLLVIFFWPAGIVVAAILFVIIFYSLRLSGTNPVRVETERVRAETTREEDLELFNLWMSQLNHEDYLLVSRTALAMISQPVFALGYIFSKHYAQAVTSEILVWSNLVISIIIYISILAAFRVYLETRIKIRPLVKKHPDFPMRRLPDIHPGLGLYCPVGLGLIMVVIWSSLLYVEAAEDQFRQIAAILVTAFLAFTGVVFAIGVGLGLGENGEDAPKSRDHL